MLFGKKRKPGLGEKRKLLLYGLQRSGTNYLESLIRLNFPGCEFLNTENRNEITHKHFRLYDDKSKIPEPKFQNDIHFQSFADFEKQLPGIPDLYLVISKDPLNWLLSYRKWAAKNNWPKPGYNYISEYNLFYGKWMEFAGESNRIDFIQYAKLLTDPQQELLAIASALRLELPQSVKTSSKVYASRKFTEQKKTEFLNSDAGSKFKPEDLDEIRKEIDKQLITKMGYTV